MNWKKPVIYFCCPNCGERLITGVERQGICLICFECDYTAPIGVKDRYDKYQALYDDTPHLDNWLMPVREFYCPDCGSELVKRKGKNGEFLGCGNYPSCKYTSPLSDDERDEKQSRDFAWADGWCDR